MFFQRQRSDFSLRLFKIVSSICVVLSLSACVETLDLPALDVFNGEARQEQGWEGPRTVDVDQKSGQPILEVSSQVSDAPVIPVVRHKKIKSERLLDEDGVWNIVEQTKSYDPAQAHLEARKNVDTRRRKVDSKLSAHFEPDAQSGKDGKIRVLRLDRGKSKSDDIYDDIRVSGRAVSRPSNTVSGGSMFDKITSVFSSKEDAEESRVVPPRKPVRGKDVSSSDGVIELGAHVDGLVHDIPLDKVLMRKPVPRDASLADRVVQSGDGGGIIRPPSLPVRKKEKSRQNNVFENVLDSNGLMTVNDVRAAVHNGNARLVIDVQGGGRYKTAVDSLRNVLRIKFEDARWKADFQASLGASNDLFGSYVANERGDGSVLFELRLKRDSKILETMILKPTGSGMHRIVVDMQK